FPYTTLFRSLRRADRHVDADDGGFREALEQNGEPALQEGVHKPAVPQCDRDPAPSRRVNAERQHRDEVVSRSDLRWRAETRAPAAAAPAGRRGCARPRARAWRRTTA